MTNVYPLRRTPKVTDPEQVSAIVVAGSGGAASTTTTYGLATALRLGTGSDVAAIDGTSDGGNLLERTGIDAIDSARAIRQLGSRMAVSSAGVVVVGHGDTTDPALVDGLLADRSLARFHDVGPALRSRRLGPLIEAGAGIVIVAPARSEPLSRMRDALGWLMKTYGAVTLARTIVTISHQMPETLIDLAPIRDALAPAPPGSSRSRSTLRSRCGTPRPPAPVERSSRRVDRCPRRARTVDRRPRPQRRHDRRAGMSQRDSITLDVRSEPMDGVRPSPAVWLVGAHGGAGVSTLAHYWDFAGDARQQWPCGTDRERESPYVVVVVCGKPSKDSPAPTTSSSNTETGACRPNSSAWSRSRTPRARPRRTFASGAPSSPARCTTTGRSVGTDSSARPPGRACPPGARSTACPSRPREPPSRFPRT